MLYEVRVLGAGLPTKVSLFAGKRHPGTYLVDAPTEDQASSAARRLYLEACLLEEQREAEHGSPWTAGD